MKKSILFIILAVVILAVNLIPSGTVPGNGEYYNHLLYLGLYDGGAVIGETAETNGTPLNTNHLLLTVLRMLPGDVFPVAALTAFYLIILGISLFILFKALGSYKGIAMVAMALVLCTKKYLAYLFTVLPFGGMFTFLISIFALLIAISVSKKVNIGTILFVTVLTLLFACYNNVTAIISIIIGILIARICRNKIGFAMGGVAVIVSIIFAFTYKGVEYLDVIKSGVENGINLYGSGTASSYTDLVMYYVKHIPDAVKHVQSLINNAFYNPPTAPFAIINKAKAIIIPTNIWIFTGVIIAVIAYCVSIYKKYPKTAELVIGLCLMSGIALKIPGFLYGISNLDKNLLLFNLVFDILITTGIVGICYITTQNKKDFKEKYGATQ